MPYNEKDREKWKKVLVADLISSDESGTDDGKSVFIVSELQWRSDKVNSFFKKLDDAYNSKKSEQAVRQTKKRICKDNPSRRPIQKTFRPGH